MDEIQRVLIKEGRKDLAQKYYKKVALDTKNILRKILSDIKQILNKLETTEDKSISETLTDKLRMKLNEYDSMSVRLATKKKSSLIPATPYKPPNVVHLSTYDDGLMLQVPYIAPGESVATKMTIDTLYAIREQDKAKALSIQNKIYEISNEVHMMAHNFEKEVLKKVEKLAKDLDDAVEAFEKGGAAAIHML
jgi:hypothetical protein